MIESENFVFGKANIRNDNSKPPIFLYLTTTSKALDKLFKFKQFNDEIRTAYKPFLSEKTLSSPELIANTTEIKLLKNTYRVLNCPRKGLYDEIKIILPNYVINTLNSKQEVINQIEDIETISIINFFIDNAKKVGYFFALPYDKIPQLSNDTILSSQLEKVIESGYLKTYKHPRNGEKIIELTDKIYYPNIIIRTQSITSSSNDFNNLPN